MLTIFGRAGRFCDGVSRRSFLKIGALGVAAGGLTLADIFRSEARAGSAGTPSRSGQHKGVINIFLGGGPPHQDMWDLKMDAPADVKGEFKPIDTKVSGLRICEVFPRMAGLMDRCVVIRSVVGASGGHDALQCTTGYPPNNMQPLGGRPSLGAVVTRLQGPVDPSVPPWVGLAAKTQHAPWSDAGRTGFLGAACNPFKPDGEGLANMKLKGVTLEQLDDRKKLREGFDGLRRDLDVNGGLVGMDAATERALNVLTSNKLLEALDVSKEPDKVRERYGDGKPYQYQYDGAPTANDQFLMARRLIEAGVRVVTLTFGRWDSHGQNFKLVRDHGGKLDQCLSALIEDLDVRGMLNDVTVVVWGEFGRTPRINKEAGRDHWPQVSCALLAGGGMRTGQVIGSTNRLGEYAVGRPVSFPEIFATLYHNLGLNGATVADPTGRPQHLSDAEPLREVV
jgi:hypothetical protein